MYRQIYRWPVVRIPLGYHGQVYVMDILKVPDLPFPVLLAWDAPNFGMLLKGALPPIFAALSDDEEAGPSGLGNYDVDDAGPSSSYVDDGTSPSATGWSIDTAFQTAQSTNRTLESVRRTLAVKKGIVVDEQRARHLPCFEQEKDILWQAAVPAKGTGTPRTQLIVPLQY